MIEKLYQTEKQFDISKVITNKTNYFEDVIQYLNIIENPIVNDFQFNIKDIGESHIALLAKIKQEIEPIDHYFIYIFSWNYDQEPPGKLTKLLKAEKIKSKNQKLSKNKVSYCKINNIEKTCCLYVGGSRTGIIPRIKQHFGFANKQIYAMQLARWCKNTNLEIKLSILSFPKTINVDIFQIIEDGLWEINKPLFGKKGAK